MKRKIVSICLTLCMLLASIRVTAFTAEAEGSVCEMGGSGYATIAAAVTDAGSTQSTIKLLSDVQESVSIPAGADITLDLNGFILSPLNGTGRVVLNNGKLTITDSSENKTHKFTPNADGLWVLDEDAGTQSVTGGCIYGGKISSEGGNFGAGVSNTAQGTLIIAGGNIVGNSVTAASKNSANGGGVSTSGTAKMTGGVICGNTVSGSTNPDGTLSGNEIADNFGAGFSVEKGGKLEMCGGCIQYNTAAGDTVNSCEGCGGGIANEGVLVLSCTTDTAPIIQYNNADRGGGISNQADFTMSGGSVQNNKAVSYGGGVFNECIIDAEGYAVAAAIFKLTGGSIASNESENGGGIHNSYELEIGGDAVITNNKVVSSGAGVFNTYKATISGGSIDHNSATWGGGISNCYELTIEGGTVSENEATQIGGGLYIQAGSQVKITQGMISSNSAVGGGGIGNNGKLEISGGTVSENSAAWYGGGVYNSSELTLSGGTVSENSSSRYGGGIYTIGKTTLSGGTVSENSAGWYGGGVYVASGAGETVLGGDIVITGNSAYSGNENLCLVSSQVTLNNLTSGAVVGITMIDTSWNSLSGRFTAAGATEADLQYFMSDNAAYSVSFNSETENDHYLELVTAPTEVAGTEFYAYLTLNDSISVNFKMTGKQEGFDTDQFKVLVNGSEIALSVAENGDVEGVLANLCPNQLSKELHVAVLYGGDTIKAFNYSVRKYCEAVLSSSAYGADSELGKLCKAVLNYGKYAEDYDNESKQAEAQESTLNADYVMDFSGVEVNDAQGTGAITNSAVGSSAAYLQLGSQITLNFKINYTGEGTLTEDDIVVLNDLTPAEKVAAAGLGLKQLTNDPDGYNYEISVKNLSAGQLSRAYTLKVQDEAVFKYGVYSYCKAVQNTESVSETLKTLCKAIYSYGEAAKAYTESLQQN